MMQVNEKAPMTIDFSHPPLNEEITAIGGAYRLIQEVRLPVDGREVLYYIGFAMVDRSCCGTMGCGYAVVQGYIRRWRYRLDGNEAPVSAIERVTDPAEENRIRGMILRKEKVNQVNFL